MINSIHLFDPLQFLDLLFLFVADMNLYLASLFRLLWDSSSIRFPQRIESVEVLKFQQVQDIYTFICCFIYCPPKAKPPKNMLEMKIIVPSDLHLFLDQIFLFADVVD